MATSEIKTKHGMKAVTPLTYGEIAAEVAGHYKSNVGTAYGICSLLVFQAADIAAQGNQEKLAVVLEACAIAWRVLYEGLGLSGYSPEAAKVYFAIHLASSDVKGGYTVAVKDGEAVPAVRGAAQEIFSAGTYLKTLAPFNGINVSEAALQMIVEARTVTKCMSRVEGLGKPPIEEWEQVIPAAVKYGALRRMSQGEDRIEGRMTVEEMTYAAEARVYIPTTLTAGFLRETKNNGPLYFDAAIQNLAEVVSTVHTKISDAKFESEINGY